MSDHIHVLTVALDRDVSVSRIEYIVNAIEMVRGVASVTDQHVSNMEDWSARERVRSELGQAISEVALAIMEGRKFTVEPRKGQ